MTYLKTGTELEIRTDGEILGNKNLEFVPALPIWCGAF